MKVGRMKGYMSSGAVQGRKSSLTIFVFPKSAEWALITFHLTAKKMKAVEVVQHSFQGTLNFIPWVEFPRDKNRSFSVKGWHVRYSFLSPFLWCCVDPGPRTR